MAKIGSVESFEIHRDESGEYSVFVHTDDSVLFVSLDDVCAHAIEKALPSFPVALESYLSKVSA